MSKRFEMSPESMERQRKMARISQEYNQKKTDEYFRNGGREAKYKELPDGSFVFDGYSD